MRYSKTHREESRARILAVAARQFRGKGTENVTVADVMSAAGLTNGGFYKHFSNKDQLLEEAVASALAEIAARLASLTVGLPRGEALKRVINTYLSEDHLRHPEMGCALAAMGTEMARMPLGMKRAVSSSLDAYGRRLDSLMPGTTKEKRRAAFRVLFSSMAGCIMAARVHTNKEVQRQILAGGRAFFEQNFCGEQAPAFLETKQ